MASFSLSKPRFSGRISQYSHINPWNVWFRPPLWSITKPVKNTMEWWSWWNGEYVLIKGFRSPLRPLIQKDTWANKDFTEVNGTTCSHISTSLSALLGNPSAHRGARTGKGTFCTLPCNFLIYSSRITRHLLPCVPHTLLAPKEYFLDFYNHVRSGRGCILFPQKQYRGERSRFPANYFLRTQQAGLVTSKDVKGRGKDQDPTFFPISK